MSVTVQQVIQLASLKHLTAEQAAAELGLTVARVEEISRVGAIVLAHEPLPPAERIADAERTAIYAKMPKKWQDRNNKERISVT